MLRCKTSWANARVKLHSQVHFGSKKMWTCHYLICPDLTFADLTCPDLTCLDLTCPELTYLDMTYPDLTYPDFTSPDLPEYHSDIP